MRRYVKEALLGVIRVHCEVHTISPHFVQRVLGEVVRSVIEETARYVAGLNTTYSIYWNSS